MVCNVRAQLKCTIVRAVSRWCTALRPVRATLSFPESSFRMVHGDDLPGLSRLSPSALASVPISEIASPTASISEIASSRLARSRISTAQSSSKKRPVGLLERPQTLTSQFPIVYTTAHRHLAVSQLRDSHLGGLVRRRHPSLPARLLAIKGEGSLDPAPTVAIKRERALDHAGRLGRRDGPNLRPADLNHVDGAPWLHHVLHELA